MSTDNCEIPQWKKELIARLRNRTARTGPPVQQPSEASVGSSVQRCEVVAGGAKMVQDRSWEQSPDSEEELRYGPGIVNKLKNKYLSLAQRESSRASILPMRKAASLENILDGEDAVPERAFRPRAAAKATPSRYARPPKSDLKRARSVETISRTEDEEEAPRTKQRESFHEEMLIKEGSGDKKMSENPPPQENNKFHRAVNRPKRIAPIMNEKEKPPADVVKQAKLIFERRPEQRTKAPQQTGDVAAKVATYKSIIVQAKAAKKPPIKVKPVVALGDGKKTNGIRTQPKGKAIQEKTQENRDEETKTPPSLPSPIPDVSRIDVKPSTDENGLTKSTSLSETPDLIMTSSPLASINSPSFRISATENFIREERRNSTPCFDKSSSVDDSQQDEEFEEVDHHQHDDDDDEEGVKKLGNRQLNLSNGTNTVTFNFAKNTKPANHLPLVNRNVSNTQTSVLQPLKLEINGVGGVEKRISPNHHHHEVIRSSTPISTSSSASSSPKPSLTILEIEKNLINVAKTLEQQPPPPSPIHNKNSGINNIASGNNSSVSIKSVEEVTKIKVPKVRKPPRELENNSIVFKFTDRKEVPDYVHNDGVRRVAKIEKPKVGEGGIILLPGASIDESFTDEDEEIMRSLECPPSPCDVTFINDNVLIDGKSSLSQKSKKAKMKISFVEAGPEIYEYPSESSLLIEDIPTSPIIAQIRHSVPSLSGSSSLGNYTPKSTEEFQPGVTRSVQQNIPTTKSSDNIESSDSEKNELILQEVEKPILFSAGANSDILF